MKEYIPTSPFLFRIIKRAMVLLIGILALLAMVIPAPLQEQANIAKTPNPAKAAWFFLWIQELASYSKYMIYVVMVSGLFYFLLPYLPRVREAKQATWLPKDQLWINIITIIMFLGILTLTIIAMFFRGKNWAFVLPF